MIRNLFYTLQTAMKIDLYPRETRYFHSSHLFKALDKKYLTE